MNYTVECTKSGQRWNTFGLELSFLSEKLLKDLSIEVLSFRTQEITSHKVHCLRLFGGKLVLQFVWLPLDQYPINATCIFLEASAVYRMYSTRLLSHSFSSLPLNTVLFHCIR